MTEKIHHLPINCPTIDTLLGNGLESGIITKIYGEAATGKTNFCLQAAKACAEQNKTVAFIDTEGVSIERFRQICGSTPTCKNTLKKIIFYRPLSFQEQYQIIKDLTTRTDIHMIVVDTINLYYRLHLDRDTEDIMRSFSHMVSTLLTTARKHNLIVLITEQVYTDKTGDIKPFSTRETAHLAKTILFLEKIGIGKRKATIIRHRSEPEGKTTTFEITQHGLTCPTSETKP